MWALYQKYWLPFGEILTDIERTGIKIDREHMQKIE
jgi:DNA polymerase-1